MSEGIHVYHNTPKGWKAHKTAKTPAQARKADGAYPSVTTVLDIMKDGFLHGVWIPKQAAELAREKIEEWEGMRTYSKYKYDIEDIPKAVYGFRTCPETGEQISSSEFGTELHNCMEHWALHGTDELLGRAYYGLCIDAIKKLEDMGIKPLEAEVVYGSDEDESAGTVDLVAELDGKLVIVDFKSRSCKGRGKFYENKDCPQLAIEAEWIRDAKNLDYLPRTFSVCICTNTGDAWIKEWKEDKMLEGAATWRACRQLYKCIHKF